MKIDTWRDPYDAGFSPTHSKQIDIAEKHDKLIDADMATH